METVFVILGWIIFSFIILFVAISKGRSGCAWFFISLLLSPIIAIIILICVGDSDEKKEASLKKAMNVIESERARGNNEQEGMAKDKAIEELQKAKKLLELEVISQEEYDAKKAELMPYLRDDYVAPKEKDVEEDNQTPKEVSPTEKVIIKIPQRPAKEKWYNTTWAPILLTSIILALVVIGLAIGFNYNHTMKGKNPTFKSKSVDSENFHDNSIEHQKIVKDKFVANLFKSDEYLAKHGTLKDYTCTFNESSLRYDVCVSFDIVRMNKMRTEIYKGEVYITPNGKFTTFETTYQANFMEDNNDGVVGRWIISLPAVNQAYELIIKKEGSTYYAYEFGKKKKLSRKGNCYYELNNKAGEYYKVISGGVLRLYDNMGDFTNESGYSIKTIYYVEPKTTSTPKPKVEQTKVSSTKVKKELQSLYNELLGFKNNTDFKSYGFDPKGAYYNWLKRAESFDNKQNCEVLVSYGITPGDVKMLGLKYVETRGQEDEYTRYIRGEIDAAILLMR